MIARFIFLIAVIGIGAQASDYPLCGECWCATGTNLTSCPSPAPASEFSPKTVSLFQQKIPNAVFTLGCNPYKDDACLTSPPQPAIAVSSQQHTIIIEQSPCVQATSVH